MPQILRPRRGLWFPCGEGSGGGWGLGRWRFVLHRGLLLRWSHGRRVVLGGEAEDIVHHENQGAIFIFREFAFGVAKGLECTAGFSAGFTVLLKLKGLPACAGEGVEEASEGGGIAAELVIEGSLSRLLKGAFSILN